MDLGLATCDGAGTSAVATILGGLHDPLEGQVATGSSGAATALKLDGGLIGASTPAASTNAQLGGRLALTGESDGHCVTITTDLIGVVHGVPLSGAASGSSSAIAASSNHPAIAGTSATRSDGAADLTITPGLAGSSGGESTTSNNDLHVNQAFGGYSAGETRTTSPQWGPTQLSIKGIVGSGSSSGSTSTAANLSATKVLAGSAAGSTSTSADAMRFAQLSGHSGKVLDLGAGESAGRTIMIPAATLSVHGIPNVALSGST